MSFCIHETLIVLCNNEQVVLYDAESDTATSISLPKLQADKQIDLHNNVNIETFHTVTNVMFSEDGKYFFVCTNRKQLCLYETGNRCLVWNRILPRAASKVRFTPRNDIVVADKTGDAYLFSSKGPENGTLLLGHLSMLLDILITENENYIVTTDRDEKIRVSMFPNSYNIVTYCLGHRKFVTNVLELPHDKSVLLSCGGDGTLMIWDYKIGKELLCIPFQDKISKDDVKEFNQELHNYNLDESVEVLPVKHLKLSALTRESSLAVMSFYNNPLILVYVIKGTLISKLEATYVQSIITDNEPIECCLHKNNLVLLHDNGFKIYEFNDDKFDVSNAKNNQINKLNDCWKVLRKDSSQQNFFSILYKRKYDNVQEYLEKKKLRLSNNVDP